MLVLLATESKGERKPERKPDKDTGEPPGRANCTMLVEGGGGERWRVILHRPVALAEGYD
jgi:hypothetical protein